MIENTFKLYFIFRFEESFDSHPFNVTEKTDVVADYTNTDALELQVRAILVTIKNSPVWVLMIQILSSYVAYIFAKFASKVQIQGTYACFLEKKKDRSSPFK